MHSCLGYRDSLSHSHLPLALWILPFFFLHTGTAARMVSKDILVFRTWPQKCQAEESWIQISVCLSTEQCKMQSPPPSPNTQQLLFKRGKWIISLVLSLITLEYMFRKKLWTVNHKILEVESLSCRGNISNVSYVCPIETAHLGAPLPCAVICAFTNTDPSNCCMQDADWYHLRTSWSF